MQQRLEPLQLVPAPIGHVGEINLLLPGNEYLLDFGPHRMVIIGLQVYADPLVRIQTPHHCFYLSLVGQFESFHFMSRRRIVRGSLLQGTEKIVELQPLVERDQLGAVYLLNHIIIQITVYLHVPDYSGQVAAHESLILVGGQVLHHFLPLDLIEVFVEILQAAEFFDQLDGGFGPHSGHPGYVVGRIAHQGFDLDHLLRVNFPFFLNLTGVVYFHLGNAFFGHVDVGALRHQLQAVIVTGDDNAVHALLLRL